VLCGQGYNLAIMYSLNGIPEAWLPYLKMYMKEMDFYDGMC